MCNLKKTKICSACNKRKSIDEFYKESGYKHGVKSQCKKCLYQFRVRDREKIRKQHNKYYKTIERSKRDLALYGITKQQYDKLLQKQKGYCGICGVHYTKLTRRLGVDHNHQTDKIRGLLCRTCNLAIGHLDGDSGITLFYASIKYLEKNEQ